MIDGLPASPPLVLSRHTQLHTQCRWGKGKTSPDGPPRVSSGHPIHFDVVGGRTTAIVLAVQRKGLLPVNSGGRKAAAPGKSRKSKAKAGSRGSVTGTGEGEGQKEGERRTKAGDDGVPKEVKTNTRAATPKANSRSENGKALVGKKAERVSKSTKGTPSKVKSEASTKAGPVKVKSETTTRARPVKGKAVATAARSRGKPKATPKASPHVATKAEAEVSATAIVTKRGRLGDSRTAAFAGPRGGKRAKSGVTVKSENAPASAEATDGSCAKVKANVGRRSARLASTSKC